MKKLLVVALALTSVNAFATRARVTALANSPHLIDAQTVYSNPADMFYVAGDYVNLEAGATSVSSTNAAGNSSDGRNGKNNAEGMIVRSWGDAKMGLALGHMSDLSLKLRSIGQMAFTNPVLQGGLNSSVPNFHQQNPIELSYGMKAGDLAWAGTLVYSNFNNKTAANEKESSMGARFGMRMGALDVKAGLGLGNTYENAQGKFKGDMGITAGAGYAVNTLYFNVKAEMGGFKVENTGGTEIMKASGMNLGAYVTDSLKKDGNEFFYGAGIENSDYKITVPTGDKKMTALSLPIWIGLEADAASWLTLRGSVKQNVILNDSKNELQGTEYAPGPNTTTISAGAGLKFNKINVDTAVTSESATAMNDLKGQVGMTYVF